MKYYFTINSNPVILYEMEGLLYEESTNDVKINR